MSERTIEEWRDYIGAAIMAAQDDGYSVDIEYDSCHSACCDCSDYRLELYGGKPYGLLRVDF